jgi:hypothetical protein
MKHPENDPFLKLFCLYSPTVSLEASSLARTLDCEEVFNTCWGDEKGQALLHGHFYTAHPIGCGSALHALESYNANLERDYDRKSGPRTSFDAEQKSQFAPSATLQTVSILQSLRQVLCSTTGKYDLYHGVTVAQQREMHPID